MPPRHTSSPIIPQKFTRALRFGIVSSTYHPEYTEAMVRAAQAELKDHAVEVVWVPGSFEVPIAMQRLARSDRYDALLAFGVVWEGKTRHAAEIVRSCTDALMRIALKNDVPVIHQILTVHSVAEAKERTTGKLSRGVEGARAALAVAAALQNLPRSKRKP
jgi:6,7-dimethyl-8-ribityllumazine synthase